MTEMRVERQGNYECMLATIAALGNVPLAEVRLAACKIANVTEWADTQGRGIFWRAVNELVRDFGITGVPRTWRGQSVGQDLPVMGRGSVIVRRGTLNHIMPFKDGLVYDSCNPGYPTPLTEYLADRPGCRVLKITRAAKTDEERREGRREYDRRYRRQREKWAADGELEFQCWAKRTVARLRAKRIAQKEVATCY